MYNNILLYRNLILPPNYNERKRSPTHEIIHNDKRRKLNDDNILSPPKAANNDIVKSAVKQMEFEILNTPLVKKINTTPWLKSCSSILKVYLY